MNRRHTMDGDPRSHRHSRFAGFTLIEILIVIAMGFVIMAIAIPYGLSAYRTYELNSATSQVVAILKLTRTEAIRQNKQIIFNSTQVTNTSTRVWTDSASNGVLQTTDSQALLQQSGNAVAIGSVPNTTPIAASIGVAALVGVNPAGGQITFDQRGAVVAPAGVYAICVENMAVPTTGYRAVLVLPSGAIQVWSMSNNGNWQQTS